MPRNERLGFGWFMVVKSIAAAFLACGLQATFAATSIPLTEVANLPTSANYGGGDKIGSKLIGATYNGGNGPGIWVAADGGYRLYLNGDLLAEDNQAGRVRFIPMTFLPGENAISVVSSNKSGAGGVLVQIDELDKSYYSGSGWVAKASVANNAWKNKGRDLSAWGAATASGTATIMPSGPTLSGFASNSDAQWVWTNNPSDTLAVLLYTFYIKAEGYGANTTGGAKGEIVIASDSASIRKYLTSSTAYTILVPEGTYDFRIRKDAATSAANSGWTWCKAACGSDNKNSKNNFYRISFTKNSCSGLGESGLSIVKAGEIESWSNWITTRNNKSLIGMGRGANLRGASLANRSAEGADNNIFRNLAVYDVNPHLIEAGDGIDVVGEDNNYVENFWVDHVSYKWISDGMDLGNVKGATVSYLDYDGANEFNCYYYDPYMHLIQNAQLTMANNYWHNSYGRVPKVGSDNMASTVHVYNSYVDYNFWHIIDASGTSSKGSQILYENNYIGEANWRVAGKDAYSKINIKNTIIKKTDQKTPYDNANGSQTTPFTDNVFTPSYSYVRRTNTNLPSEIPSLAGVGGRFGTMPTYNQAFGQSNKAATVSLTVPSANATYAAGASVTLTANAADKDGSIKNVEFYVGNEFVGASTASPYQMTVAGIPEGTFSAVAVATDNSGLKSMSSYVTFTVGNASATVSYAAAFIKHAAGSSSQSITLGDSIQPFNFGWTNATKISYEGVPAGIKVVVDSAAKTIYFSGTPTKAGTFTYTLKTLDADSNATRSGTFTITDAGTMHIKGIVQAAPTEAESFGIFDLQGRPLYAGERLPAKMPATNVIIVEYGASGKIIRTYAKDR